MTTPPDTFAPRDPHVAEFRAASDEMETLCDALAAAFWDKDPDSVTPADAVEIEKVNDALRTALAPWRDEIIARYRQERRGRRYGCAAATLWGESLPAIPRAKEL